MELIDRIKIDARTLNKTIVLPESFEDRTLKAADEVLNEGIAKIVLIGNRDQILKQAKSANLLHIEQAKIVDPTNYEKLDAYAQLMSELRKEKGVTKEIALDQLKNPLYLSTIMIKSGDADGEVAGAMNATSDVLRPAFQYVKMKKGISIVSGAFLMFLKDTSFGENGLMVFADCAVHPDPDARQLAEIAVITCFTARKIAKIEPRIAILSFSTKGSATHPMVDKVIEATEIARKMAPEMIIDGELQADAAIIPAIAEKKSPGSKLSGRANVLIFPNLESGNIAYKLVQRLAHAEAIGPILQGLAAPINDLSRGCSVSDIVNMIAITANQAGD